MSYQVYEQTVDGVTRWAGYSVPTECDYPGCHKMINRGQDYQCTVIEDETMSCGCGLFFCNDHFASGHFGFTPKGESLEWMNHVLSDSTWLPYLEEHPMMWDKYCLLTGRDKND